MKTNMLLAILFTAGMATSQVVIPDGTKVRVWLEQDLFSETAALGQAVDFSVAQEVRLGDDVVIARGARATGSIVGRSEELDFTIERVQLADGNWLNVRYTPRKTGGRGDASVTGVLTAGGLAMVWPLTKGRIFDVYADESTYVAVSAMPPVDRLFPCCVVPFRRDARTAAAPAMLSINSNQPGAAIEVDGMFVGNAPTTIQLASGVHQLVVRQGASIWQHNIQLTGGPVTITARLGSPVVQRAAEK
jgi:hypothetical protein